MNSNAVKHMSRVHKHMDASLEHNYQSGLKGALGQTTEVPIYTWDIQF